MSTLCDGNAIVLLESGSEFFPALLRAIAQANRDILLETYIFADDVQGRAVAAALCEAAGRGVRVRVLVDGFGSRAFVRTVKLSLEHAGVEVLVYRREINPWSLRRHRLRRLHRKLALIDGRTGFVGGINLINDLEPEHPTHRRFDFAVELRGPLVGELARTMRHVWRLVAWASLRQRLRDTHAPMVVAAPAGALRAEFLIRDNFRHRHDIEGAYLAAISQARDEVIIACAYFFPGRRFRSALADAAARGVSVLLLLQGPADHPVLSAATRALYPWLVARGIRVFEYRHSVLHAKVAVVDEHWATVGSSNIDPFSLLLAREANVVVHDAGFASDLRSRLIRAISESTDEMHARQSRGPLRRMVHWLAFALVRAVLSLTGYGRAH